MNPNPRHVIIFAVPSLSRSLSHLRYIRIFTSHNIRAYHLLKRIWTTDRRVNQRVDPKMCYYIKQKCNIYELTFSLILITIWLDVARILWICTRFEYTVVRCYQIICSTDIFDHELTTDFIVVLYVPNQMVIDCKLEKGNTAFNSNFTPSRNVCVCVHACETCDRMIVKRFIRW